MQQSLLSFVGSLDTLIAVTIGAFLATGGALATELIKERGARRRREREAAIFLADTILSFLNFGRLANRSQTIGRSWGPFTITYFEEVLKQTSFYEANRMKLFDLRDLELRSHAEFHILAQTKQAKGIVETHLAIVSLEKEIGSLEADGSDARRDQIEERLKELRYYREVSLKGFSYNFEKAEQLITDLEPIAGVKFGDFNQFEMAVSNMQDALSKFAEEFEVIDGEVFPKEDKEEAGHAGLNRVEGT